MGSFAAHVALPEPLRPWASAGLELLFLPGGLPTLAAPVAGPDADAIPALEVLDEAPGHAMDTTPLPEPWQGLAARVRTPPRVIVTYASLADDLAGSADPAWRRQLQNILAYFAWPQGTTLFWPLTFATGADPGALFAADIFAEGVRRFRIQHILCFGEAAAERAITLYPQTGKSPDVFVHRAPAPEALVSLLPHQLHKALAHLKGLSLD